MPGLVARLSFSLLRALRRKISSLSRFSYLFVAANCWMISSWRLNSLFVFLLFMGSVSFTFLSAAEKKDQNLAAYQSLGDFARQVWRGIFLSVRLSVRAILVSKRLEIDGQKVTCGAI